MRVDVEKKGEGSAVVARREGELWETRRSPFVTVANLRCSEEGGWFPTQKSRLCGRNHRGP